MIYDGCCLQSCGSAELTKELKWILRIIHAVVSPQSYAQRTLWMGRIKINVYSNFELLWIQIFHESILVNNFLKC